METKLKPWISKELVKKINLKNNLGKKCNKHPSNANLRSRYLKLCNEVRKEVHLERDNFYRKEFRSSYGNPKKEWSIINGLLNRSSKSNDSTIVLCDDNGKFCDPEVVANLLMTTSYQ